MILNIFSAEPVHPLADSRELRRVLAALPIDNDFKAVDEVVAWLESLEHADRFRADKLNEAVRLLDEAAQPHIRRLSREFLTSSRLSKMEERRYWSTSVEFWDRLAAVYQLALVAADLKDKAAGGLKSFLPLITSRLIHALGAKLKWISFRYGPVESSVWERMGKAYLAAETGKFAARPLQLYPGLSGATTPAQEYLKSLILAASSLDSLQPLEVELAEHLIEYLLPHFVLSAQDRPDNLYWVDAANGKPPVRLARLPQASPTIRFVSPGKAPAAIAELARQFERGTAPDDLALGGQYSNRIVLAVLRHIASYWAEKPPVRQHQRHPVHNRLFVLHGFDSCSTMFDGAAGALGESAETWVVDNVSIGGFGTVVACRHDDWLRIGMLLCVQPEGGDNWLLGVVRRYAKESGTQAGVGIQTIARQAQTIRLRQRGSASYSAAPAIVGIRCIDDDISELRLVLSPNTFDVRENLDTQIDGRIAMLTPVDLVETGPDFEIARYRVRFAD